jgi:hypothetical protein
MEHARRAPVAAFADQMDAVRDVLVSHETEEIAMTRMWVSATAKSLLTLVAAALVSSGAAAQGFYGGVPPRSPFGAAPQNLFGPAPPQNSYSAPSQSSYGAQAPNLYVYPSRGQSQEQQDRDRYECHNWAVSQTGFDPTRSAPVGSAAPPPATHGSSGNLEGAAIQALGGALGGGSGAIGGAANALAGQVSRPGQTGAVPSQQASPYAAQMDGYKRAETACLQGRGYTVN